MYRLYSAEASGGTIIEKILKYANASFQIKNFDWDELRADVEYKKINPLAQIPALVLPDGEVITESLAIALYLDHKHNLRLAPMNNPHFLRWSVFLVGSIYPTFTFGDVPKTWVSTEEAQKELRLTSDEARKSMWLQMEEAASDGEWFLGSEMSIIDFYLSLMCNWRPGKAWFGEHCPKLTSFALKIH